MKFFLCDYFLRTCYKTVCIFWLIFYMLAHLTIRECLFLKCYILTLSSIVLQSLDLNKYVFVTVFLCLCLITAVHSWSCSGKCHSDSLPTYLSSLTCQKYCGLSSDELFCSPFSPCSVSSISSHILFSHAHFMISGLLLAVFLLISCSILYIFVILPCLVLLLILKNRMVVASSLCPCPCFCSIYLHGYVLTFQ